MTLAVSKPMHNSSLLRSDDVANGIVKAIDTQGLTLNASAVVIPGGFCGAAYVVFVLDPFMRTPDSNRSNNVLVVPVLIGCGNYTDQEQCMVIADYTAQGKRK